MEIGSRKLNKPTQPPSDRKFRQLAIDLAFSFCPPIHKCGRCKYPVVDGYCCTFCGYGGGNHEEQDII